jgi:hypothetical protein
MNTTLNRPANYAGPIGRIEIERDAEGGLSISASSEYEGRNFGSCAKVPNDATPGHIAELVLQQLFHSLMLDINTAVADEIVDKFKDKLEKEQG